MRSPLRPALEAGGSASTSPATKDSSRSESNLDRADHLNNDAALNRENTDSRATALKFLSIGVAALKILQGEQAYAANSCTLRWDPGEVAPGGTNILWSGTIAGVYTRSEFLPWNANSVTVSNIYRTTYFRVEYRPTATPGGLTSHGRSNEASFSPSGVPPVGPAMSVVAVNTFPAPVDPEPTTTNQTPAVVQLTMGKPDSFGQVDITANGTPHARFALESTTNLSPQAPQNSTWTTEIESTQLDGAGTATNRIHIEPNVAAKFFRARLLP